MRANISLYIVCSLVHVNCDKSIREFSDNPFIVGGSGARDGEDVVVRGRSGQHVAGEQAPGSSKNPHSAGQSAALLRAVGGSRGGQ